MSLDLSETMAQLEALGERLQGAWQAQRDRLARSVRVLEAAEGDALNRRVADSQGHTFFLPADTLEPPGARYPAADPPADFCVLSADGSHIDVDRHLPVRCFLINIGVCQLVYGSNTNVKLFQKSSLAATEDELFLSAPDSRIDSQPIEGVLLGIKRSVEELEALSRWARDLPPGLPTLALIDGSLILSEIVGEAGRYKEFVRKALLDDGYLRAMDGLRESAKSRRLALAAYVSLPGRREVVNTLRLALCDFDPVGDCNRHCKMETPGQRHCDDVHDFTDRELFAQVLAPGERSALFGTRSSVVRDSYEPRGHGVRFFYVNVGEEIGRVEMPAWVAEDPELLALTHALVVDQCRRGQGYPVAIQEAHEQAVISGSDREEFRRMVEMMLEGRRLPVYTSEKQRSKRLRGV
jgi:GNAT superfamily N-acetyltransferase